MDIASPVFHYLRFAFARPKSKFEKAMLILSIDVDVGTSELGLINQGKNDLNVHDFFTEKHVGAIEEQALPLLVDLFDSLKIPATFAVRGQFAEIDDYFIPLLLNSKVCYDIGGHGYSHKPFHLLSRREVESELSLLLNSFKNYGVKLGSFVFPRNKVAHLDLLEEFGYECFREAGTFLYDGMYIQKRGCLLDIHPSLFINKNLNPVFLVKILKLAIKKRAPIHFWFHPWNFGETDAAIKQGINRVLKPFLEYAKNQEEIGKLTFETMLSASRKASCLFNV